MKNEAIASEASAGRGLARRPAPLRQGPAPPRRRRAHAPRVRHRPRQLGRWARAQRLAPADVDYHARCAATPRACPSAGAAPRRSPASWPRCARFFRSLVEHGEMGANPADLLAAAQAAAAAPARAQGRRRRRAARPHPRHDAAGAARPRAVRARLRLRPARRGARQPRRRPRSTSTASSCASRARAPRRASCPPASPRCGALARYLERGRPALTGADRTSPRCSSPRPAAGSPRPTSAAACASGRATRGPGRGAPARPAALVRDPSAGGRRRPARDPGAAWPRNHLHDPGLHSGRVRAAAGGVRSAATRGPERRGMTLETNVKAIELRGPLAPLQGQRRPSAPASSSSSPTRRWSSTSPAACPPACPRTSRRPTSSPTA